MISRSCFFVVLGLLVVVLSYCCILICCWWTEPRTHICKQREYTQRVYAAAYVVQIRTEYKNTMRKKIPCKKPCKNCSFAVCENRPAVLQKSARRRLPFAVYRFCKKKKKRKTANGKRKTANGKRRTANGKRQAANSKRAVPQTSYYIRIIVFLACCRPIKKFPIFTNRTESNELECF